MRRPHRNIEIFSMSVLDMFASALGAFIMCSVILFPYYKKDVSQELAETNIELKKQTVKLDIETAASKELKAAIQMQAEKMEELLKINSSLNQCEKGLNKCQADLTKNFLLVQIDWKMKIGVDLHVTDTSGNEFFWEKTNRSGRDFPNSKAQLSITTIGDSSGGIQVWVDPQATEGTYKVECVLPDIPDADVPVAVSVFDRFGRKPIVSATLRKNTPRSLIATIQIAGDGTVVVR